MSAQLGAQQLSAESGSRLNWPAVRIAILAAVTAVLVCGSILPPAYVCATLAMLAGLALTLRYPVVGLGLLAFAVPWGGGFSPASGGVSATPVDVVVAGLGVAWLVRSAAARVSPIETTLWTPFVVLFIVAISLSATQAADWHASLREIVKWLELGVVYLAATSFLQTRRDLYFVLAALVAAGVSQALLGFAQFFFTLGPAAFLEHRLFLRAYGSFDQPNPYAGYLNMIWPLSLSLAVLLRGPARGWFLGSATLMVGAIVLSQSRGAALAGMAAAAVLAYVLWSHLRGLLRLGLLAAVTGSWLASFGLVPTGPFERVLAAVGLANVSFGSVTTANFSAIERAAHWLAGVRMFAAHPLLGVGIGNYGAAYPAYHPRGWYASLEHAHNYYINVAAEAGMVGLTAYTLLAGTALWYSYAAFRRASDPLCRAAVLGVLGALVATSLHNLFDVLYVHGTVALLGALMALIPASLRLDGDALGTEMGTAASE